MHELKVARSQALTTREMAQIGLFTWHTGVLSP